jgi:hypothetical protein
VEGVLAEEGRDSGGQEVVEAEESCGTKGWARGSILKNASR